jgi:hypothetical protein
MGVNLKGSLQFENPLPQEIKELGGAPGALAINAWEAAQHFSQGEYSKGFEKALPTVLGSGLKGLREYSEGVTKANYSPLFYGHEPVKADLADVAKRVLSFNPSRLSGLREKQWREEEIRRDYLEKRKDIAAQYRHWLIKEDRNEEDLLDILAEIQDYNNLAMTAHARYMVPFITPKWLYSVIGPTFKPSKIERMRDLD